MMLNTIDKTRKTLLSVCLVLFLLSLSYVTLYRLVLDDYSSMTFTLTYTLLNIALARPVLYFSISALLGTVFLLWADKSISKKVRKFSLSVFFILLSAYLLFTLFQLNIGLPYLMYLFLFNTPILYIVMGLSLSLSVTKG